MIIETDKAIETIQQSRNLFINLLDGMSIETLNEIPEGFNNNIIWNFGHVIVSQQILCYKLANMPLKIDASYVSKYSKGTKPVSFIDAAELDFLKQQAVFLIDELIVDIQAGIFDNYETYTTSFGVVLNEIEDAVKYIAMHEGLHLGYVMALKKIVNK
jgi:DinB superfamily